jgi:hypothetical protein
VKLRRGRFHNISYAREFIDAAALATFRQSGKVRGRQPR